MRSFSLRAVQSDEFKSNDSTMLDNFSKTIDVSQKIRSKIKTFTQFDYKTALLKKKTKLQIDSNLIRQNTNVISFSEALLNFAMGTQSQSKNKLKNTVVLQQLDGIKTERRQRFKKVQNPMTIINFYKKNEGFQPTQQQLIILDRIVKLKQFLDQSKPLNLEITLKKIYKILNIAIDLNQSKFFLLVILLAGELCFQAKEFNSAFYFFNQTLIASTCMRIWSIKLQALIYLGRICTETLEFSKATIVFKKALQYAWRNKDSQAQLRVYDLIGQSFNSQGKSKQALYYHNRYILGQFAKSFSAVKRTSYQLLKQYQKTLNNSQKQNLNLLFLGYLRLPINNFSEYPPFRINKVYPNYINNQSPRKECYTVSMELNQFPDVHEQINILLKTQDFRTQIPNPDLYTNFVASNKYGKHRKQIEFQQSNQHHKIVGYRQKQTFRANLRPPIQQQIKNLLQQKPNPHWWEEIVLKSKRQRTQKLGSIRNKVRKTHLSFEKFPEQKKKYLQLKSERVIQTINKIILNYIDPIKV